MYLKKRKKSPRASKRSKKIKKRYEERLFVWFTISIFLLVLLALAIFFINKIETKNLQDDVVAIVNGQKITANELDNWYRVSINPEYRNIIKKEDFLVESLIPQKILIQETEKNDIDVDKDEVDTALGKYLIDAGLNLKDFEEKLKKDGTSIAYVKEAFRQRLVISKFLDRSILSKIDVSISEVNEIFRDTTSLDPSLTVGEVKNILRDQLLMRKQSEAIEDYVNQLRKESEIELFIGKNEIISFSETKDEVCEEEGKPVIRLYTTSKCNPCKWIKARFDSVIKDYLEEDEIVAYHWEIDSGDNTLTKETEEGVPKQEIEIFKKYSPEAMVPTYVFGCKYVRIGNFYEQSDNLDAEEEEFRTVINKLI